MPTDLLIPHLDRMRCPHCSSSLVPGDEGADCPSCARTYPVRGGYLDLAPDLTLPTTTGLGPLLLQDPLQIARYEDLTRPAYLRVAAANWDTTCTPEQEFRYLQEHAEAADGPVVDVACGAGRWTKVLVDKFGGDQVIGLDLSLAMLHAIEKALPTISLVRASAMNMPFGDGTLGGVNCSAALQIMPDAGAVIGEFGRCLRQGGTFTLASLTHAPRPLQRYFQHQQESMFNTKSFLLEDVLSWVRAAGMEPVDVTQPASFLLLTARKL